MTTNLVIPCAGSVEECIQRKQFIEDPKTKEPRIVVNGCSLFWSGLLVFGIAFPAIMLWTTIPIAADPSLCGRSDLDLGRVGRLK